MNILFVSCYFRLFGNPDCGGATRSNMFLKALSQIGDVDVVSFYKEPQLSDIPNCHVVWDKYIPISVGAVAKKLRKIRLLLSPSSPRAYYPLNRQCESIVNRQYNKKKYDIIACRYIMDAVTCGLEKFSSKLVIDVDDNLISAYKRNMSVLIEKHPWTRGIALFECRHVGRMQERFLRKVMCSFYSNIEEPTSKGSFYLHNVASQTVSLPAVTEITPVRLLFVGWLDFPPNKNGIIHFVRKVFPLIKKRIPKAELHIVGKSKDVELLKQFNAIDGVSALGYVEDIIEEYRNCRAVVLPIYDGAGTSVKFIEGLMMNRPVLSTPMGVRGFEKLCTPCEHYMLAETDDQFAEKAAVLLESVSKANEMAKKANIVGRANFSQEKFCEIVKNAIRISNGENIINYNTNI